MINGWRDFGEDQRSHRNRAASVVRRAGWLLIGMFQDEKKLLRLVGLCTCILGIWSLWLMFHLLAAKAGG